MEPLPGDPMSDESRASSSPDVPDGPYEVAAGCWMVGRRNPESLLQCNTYVRSFERGSSAMHVCVDPGSQFDYEHIQRNITRLLGDVGELSSYSLNHQDPDVIGNAIFLAQANPNISVIVTEETWRLAQHLLTQPRRVHFANAARLGQIVLADQYRWQLVPTPFCHFRGAMAFYDPELRTLFSGDLFGGLNLLGRVHLEATEADWAGIAQFHQIYMPTREALRYAVRQIKSLTPAVEVIAPQHGHIIRGELVSVFLERMYDLLVGHDLVVAELDETYLSGYGEVIARLLDAAAEVMGREEAIARLRAEEPHDGLERCIAIRDMDVELQREGYSATVKVFARLARREATPLVNTLRSIVLGECAARQLPIPPIGAGVEDMDTPSTVGPDGILTTAWWLK